MPQYAKVRYRDLYPGVDLLYYGNDRHLEYDFIVTPGADPSMPRFAVDGADRIRVDADGDLVMETRAGEIRHRRPTIYQEIGGVRTTVAGGYRVIGNEVSFRVGSYDRSRTLVIDPALSYATFLGGERDDHVSAIAVDSAGNAYVTGSTQSAGFPTVIGSYDVVCGTDGNCNGGNSENRDVFVSKINPTGTALVYSTFVGGRANDVPLEIALDSAGNAYVSGTTSSLDFPVTSGAYNPAGGPFGAGVGFFLFKLNPTGSALTYSTRPPAFTQSRIAVDASGGVYLAGPTEYNLDPCQRPPTINSDAFVAKLNAAGSVFEYCYNLSGAGVEAITGLAIDRSGNAIIAGHTSSLDFPVTPNAHKTVFPTGAYSAGFVAKLNASGSALMFSTYTDPTPSPGMASVAVDSQQQVFVSQNGSVIKYDSNGSTRAFTHAGQGALYVDASDNVYLYQGQRVQRVTPSGIELLYETVLPIPSDYQTTIKSAIDARANLYFAASGLNLSQSLSTPGALRQQPLGGFDLFVAKITRPGGTLRFFPTAITAILPPGTNPAAQVQKHFWVLSDGSPHPVEVPYTVAAGASWVSAASGTASPENIATPYPSSLSVTNSPGSGVHSANLNVTSPGAENNPASLPVTLAVTSSPYYALPASLTFHHTIGTSGPAPQLATMQPVGSPPGFSIAANSTGWLFVSPTTGTGFTTITITANPAGLTAGSYFGTVDAAWSGAPSGGVSMPVRLIVSEPGLTTLPGALSFTQRQGKEASAAQVLSISGTGVYTLSAPGASWLRLSQGSGSLPGTVNVSVDAAGLTAGTHRATITISSSSSTVSVPVTLVLLPPNSLSASVTELSYSYWPGASIPPQTVTISSDPSVNWTAFATSSGNWLSVTPTGGSTPGNPSINVNPSGLALGKHTGSISIVSPDVANSPLAVQVTVTIAASEPVTVSPASLAFTAAAGGAAQSKTLSISAAGGKSLTASASSAGGWLSVLPASSAVPATLTVTVNPSGLPQGSHSGTITIQVTLGDNSIFPVTVPVGVTVTGKNDLRVSPSQLSFYAWPGAIVPIGSATVTVASEITSYGMWSAEANVPWLSTMNGPVLGPQGYQSTVYPQFHNLAPGNYTGTLTFTADGATNGPQVVTVNLTVLASPPVLPSSGSLTFSYQEGAKPAPRTVSLAAANAMPFTVTTTAAWLSASPSSGTAPANLSISVDPTGFARGTYSANVVVEVTLGTGAKVPVSIPVALVIGPPQLIVSSPQLTFSHDTDGIVPAPQWVSLTSSDESITQSLTVTSSTVSGGDWLDVTPATGSTPMSLRVSVKPEKLETGTYSGYISVASPMAGNNPQVIQVTLKVGPVLTAISRNLTFRYATATAAAETRTVRLESGGTPTSFGLSIKPQSGGDWLHASPAQGTTPANLTVTASPAGLPPGVYFGTVEASSQLSLNNIEYISVRMEVGPAISTSPGVVSFTANSGSTAQLQEMIAVATGNQNLAYQVTSGGGSWLSVAPVTGKTPAILTLTANPAGLPDGEYSASVLITAPESSTRVQTIPVALRIGPRLSASQTSIAWTSPVNGQALTSPSITISGGGSLAFVVSPSSNAGWLSVTPNSGTTPSSITATANPINLSPGVYTATISISAPGAVNSLSIPVTLNVGGGSTVGGFSVLPAALSFSYQVNGAGPAAQHILLNATSPTIVNATVTGGSWLSVAPQAVSAPGALQVAVNPVGLSAGVHTANISLSAYGAATQTIPVTLVVQEGSQLILSASSLAFAAAPGASGTSSQTVDVSSSGARVRFRVGTSAAWLQASPAEGTTTANVSISVNPAGMPPGSYNGSVTITPDVGGARTISVSLTISSQPMLTVSPAAIHLMHRVGGEAPMPVPVMLFSEARLSYTAQVTGGGWLSVSRPSGRLPDFIEVAANPEGLAPGVYTGTLSVSAADAFNTPQTITVKLTVKAPAPVISAGGIVNAASYRFDAIAPGTLISIFGENLAPSERRAESAPWPTALNGVSVTINGIAASLSMVSPGQIDAQVPLELGIGIARLVVTTDGRPGAGAVFPLVAAGPGIFQLSGDDSAVQNADFSGNTETNPSPSGTIVIAYLTGQGKLDSALSGGMKAPLEPVCRPISKVEATIDGQPAEVLFSGMTPGLVGILQVNLRIPDLVSGRHRLLITVGGIESNSVPVHVGRSSE